MAFLTDQFSWNIPLTLAIVSLVVMLLCVMGAFSAFRHTWWTTLVKRSGFAFVALGFAWGFLYMNERLNSFLASKMADQSFGTTWMTKLPIEILWPTAAGALLLILGYITGFIEWGRDIQLNVALTVVALRLRSRFVRTRLGRRYEAAHMRTLMNSAKTMTVEKPMTFGQYYDLQKEAVEANKLTKF